MQERGFDSLQNGMGPGLLIGSTIILILIIIAGGMFMQLKEREWREAHAEEKTGENLPPPSPSLKDEPH
jgi:hypothetical protein